MSPRPFPPRPGPSGQPDEPWEGQFVPPEEVTVDQIMDCAAKIDALERIVAPLVNPPLPFERVNMFNPSVSVTFAIPNLTPQEATWANTGGDFYLTRLGYVVWMTQLGQNSAQSFQAQRLVDTGMGLGWQFEATGVPFPRYFDFEWNMRQRINGNMYGVAPAGRGGNGYVSRQSLGNLDRGDAFEFIRPKKIAMGDALTFSINPLGYVWGPDDPAPSALQRFIVQIMMTGFRTGVR